MNDERYKWRTNGIIRSLCIRKFYEGYPRIYASWLQTSSVWVLKEWKGKKFEYAVNTDSPPPLSIFPNNWTVCTTEFGGVIFNFVHIVLGIMFEEAPESIR